MERLRLGEVLVEHVRVARWVNPDVSVATGVLNQSVTDDLTETVVEAEDFVDSLLFLMLADPVLGVSSAALVVNDSVLGDGC